MIEGVLPLVPKLQLGNQAFRLIRQTNFGSQAGAWEPGRKIARTQ